MSQYQPKPGTLSTIRGFNGWYIYDKNGYYDGPFLSAFDAHVIIAHAERGEPDMWLGKSHTQRLLRN